MKGRHRLNTPLNKAMRFIGDIPLYSTVPDLRNVRHIAAIHNKDWPARFLPREKYPLPMKGISNAPVPAMEGYHKCLMRHWCCPIAFEANAFEREAFPQAIVFSPTVRLKSG
jgi:hypothetical protein